MNDMKNTTAPQAFTGSARLKSFAYAIQGIAFMLKTQHNAWLHLVATLVVIALGLYCRISLNDWRWLVTAIAMVWFTEAFNTAVEYVCDVVSPSYLLAVKRAKDVAAGGVLIAAVAAAIIGALTFWPYVAS